MHPAIRVLLALGSFVGGYLGAWLLVWLVTPGDYPGLASLAGLVTGVVLAVRAWRVSREPPESAAIMAGYGAATLGAIGFVGGFFGPMIFAPEANQGPMLGIFITGPGGAALGAIAGYLYGRRTGG